MRSHNPTAKEGPNASASGNTSHHTATIVRELAPVNFLAATAAAAVNSPCATRLFRSSLTPDVPPPLGDLESEGTGSRLRNGDMWPISARPACAGPGSRGQRIDVLLPHRGHQNQAASKSAAGFALWG